MSDTTRTVILSQPIERAGADPITTIVVCRPSTGALRGLSLMSLMQMEVNTLALLLPRITQPALLPADMAALDPADLLAMGGEVLGFFMGADERAALGMNRP